MTSRDEAKSDYAMEEGEVIGGNRMGRGRVELPTHGFSVRRADSTNPKPGNELRHHGGAAAHHLPIAPNQADTDPNLTAIIEAWPALPESVKAALVAMVGAVSR